MKKSILILSFCLFITAVNAQDKKTEAPVKAVPAAPVPASVDNKNAPEIKFEFETYDFGTIKQGDRVTYDFVFTNTGKEPLIISQAQGSCGCTVSEWPKEPIAKGAKGKIHVEFNSTGKVGMQDKTVTISSNGKSGQKVLHLKGNVDAPPVTPGQTPEEHKH